MSVSESDHRLAGRDTLVMTAASLHAFPPKAWQILVPTVRCPSRGDVQGLSPHTCVDISLHIGQKTLPCREQTSDLLLPLGRHLSEMTPPNILSPWNHHHPYCSHGHVPPDTELGSVASEWPTEPCLDLCKHASWNVWTLAKALTLVLLLTFLSSPSPSTHMVTQAIMWPNMLERAWIWGDTGAHACTTRGCGHLVMSPQRKYLFYTLTPELHNG